MTIRSLLVAQDSTVCDKRVGNPTGMKVGREKMSILGQDTQGPQWRLRRTWPLVEMLSFPA